MGSAVERMWKVHGDGRTVGPDEVVRPNERLRMPYMLGLGGQHVLAMFGATALVPVLIGFPVTTTIFFSGVGTILFNLITRNRLPLLHGIERRVHRAGGGREGGRRPARRARRDRVRRHRDGDVGLDPGDYSFAGIALGTLAAIVIYQVLRAFQPKIGAPPAGAFGDSLAEPLAATPDPRRTAVGE